MALANKTYSKQVYSMNTDSYVVATLIYWINLETYLFCSLSSSVSIWILYIHIQLQFNGTSLSNSILLCPHQIFLLSYYHSFLILFCISVRMIKKSVQRNRSSLVRQTIKWRRYHSNMSGVVVIHIQFEYVRHYLYTKEAHQHLLHTRGSGSLSLWW